MFLSKKKRGTKAVSIMLVAAMISSVAVISAVSTSAASENTQAVSSGDTYGLKSNIQDGTILHCFDWKYKDIKAELPNIAAAGFSSVQTSPAQVGAGSGTWWWLYQPLGFYVGNNDLGTKADLQSLCDEADKYGIKVVVDVVANHLAGDHSNIQNDLKDSQYWHHAGGGIDYFNRRQIHQGEIGMPDINSENEYVQQCVRKYVEELAGMGVDGIRWDAAKHIGLPSENCNFWPAVTQGTGLWTYGEILDDPVASDGNRDNREYAESLMKEYTKYISVTDSGYGADVRMAFRSGKVTQSVGNFAERGISKDKLVYWAESHDTYSNDKSDGEWDSSQFIDQNKIDRAYAVVAAQNKATSLYFSRPSSKSKNDIKAGKKGSTHYTSKEVAEVNRFHNENAGKADYYKASNGCAVVTRKDGGAVIVKGSGSGKVSVENGGGYAKPGTYKDQVSGNTFTITASTISGEIGSTGIAVIYDAKPIPSISAAPGTESDTYTYKTNTLSVTLNASNVSNAKYSLDGGSEIAYTDGTKITLGEGKPFETLQALKLTATDTASGKTLTKTYTFLKSNKGTSIYFDNSSYNWSNIYAYIYKDDGGSSNEIAAWPGVQLTNKSAANGYFVYDLPEDYENARVIWSDGSGSSSNRYPADMEPGLSIDGKSHLLTSGNTWKEYNESVTPTEPTTPTSPTTPTAPPVNYKYVIGDVSGDGVVTLKDASLIQRALLGNLTLTEKQQKAADIVNDGKITVADVVAVLRYLVGYDNVYKIGEVVTVTSAD